MINEYEIEEDIIEDDDEEFDLDKLIKIDGCESNESVFSLENLLA